jgi:hypothetical protein
MLEPSPTGAVYASTHPRNINNSSQVVGSLIARTDVKPIIKIKRRLAIATAAVAATAAAATRRYLLVCLISATVSNSPATPCWTAAVASTRACVPLKQRM